MRRMSQAARKEVAEEVVRPPQAHDAPPAFAATTLAAAPMTIEKIVERIVDGRCAAGCPIRARPSRTSSTSPATRDTSPSAYTRTARPAKSSSPWPRKASTIGGLMDTIATLVSVSLQYGVPVESLVRKFEHVRFEPSGMTRNPDIPFAKSLVDYIFRWLAMEFVPGYRAANAPKRDGREDRPANPPALPPAKEGNGHGHRVTQDDARPFAYTEAEQKTAHANRLAAEAAAVGPPAIICGWRLCPIRSASRAAACNPTPRRAMSAAQSPSAAACATSASTAGIRWGAANQPCRFADNLRRRF